MLTITREGKSWSGSTGRRRPTVRMREPSAFSTATCWKVCPSVRSTVASVQFNRRRPLPTMASNTGCTSVGELLMTRRMSALAVWWASASCVSLNSRTFWIAITAWSTKVAQQRDLLGAELAGLAARDAQHADALVTLQRCGSISDERMPSPACTRCSCGGSSIGQPVGQVQHRAC